MNNGKSEYDIELFNITKKYKIKGKNKEITALDNINLKIKKGEIFGLLGPNGAGKTTMVSILTTLIQPTSGYAEVLGYNILKHPWIVKKNVGLMLGGDMIYVRLTGYQNLKFFCKIYGIKNYKTKIDDIAEKFNLTKWLNQYAGYYSSGMKLKLAIARVLLTEPKILFLDEPMLGLDPTTVKQIIEMLIDLNKTILLTSHQMDIVQRLCDRIAFLKQGKVIKVDNQENFKKLITDKTNIIIKVSKNSDELVKFLNNLEFVSDVKEIGNEINFSIINKSYFPEVFKVLKNFPVISITEKKPSLNEVFIKLSS